MKSISVVVIGHIEVFHGDLAVILDALVVCSQILLTIFQLFVILYHHCCK